MEGEVGERGTGEGEGECREGDVCVLVKMFVILSVHSTEQTNVNCY